jgi:holin-like protein
MFMRGIGIIIGFNFLGLLLHAVFNIPLPANVLGLILLTAALFAKLIKVEWIEESAEFLVRHMMLFFAPVIVSTMTFSAFLGQYWASIFISLTLSTLVVMGVTGFAAKSFVKKEMLTDGSERMVE